MAAQQILKAEDVSLVPYFATEADKKVGDCKYYIVVRTKKKQYCIDVCHNLMANFFSGAIDKMECLADIINEIREE